MQRPREERHTKLLRKSNLSEKRTKQIKREGNKGEGDLEAKLYLLLLLLSCNDKRV
jgi:hypothetical protein